VRLGLGGRVGSLGMICQNFTVFDPKNLLKNILYDNLLLSLKLVSQTELVAINRAIRGLHFYTKTSSVALI